MNVVPPFQIQELPFYYSYVVLGAFAFSLLTSIQMYTTHVIING